MTAVQSFKSDLILQLPLLKITSLENNSTFQNTALIFKVVWQLHFLWLPTDEICSNVISVQIACHFTPVISTFNFLYSILCDQTMIDSM